MKVSQTRHERKFNEILKLPGNDRCADCNNKNARWCSYNLGIFLCIRCASLHRKMGTHISKVKSLSMDSFSNEQIDSMKSSGGNQKVNSIINPHPEKHPLPLEEEDNFAMEHYIRRKWEKQAFREDDDDHNNNNNNSYQTIHSPVLSINSSLETSSLQTQSFHSQISVSKLSSSLPLSVEEFAGQVHPQQQDIHVFSPNNYNNNNNNNTNPFYTSSSPTFTNNPFYSSPVTTTATTNNPFFMNEQPKSNNPFL